MRGLERLRRETVSHPDAPWALEHGQREEVQDQGEVASDEDYEYQVALALSQSANDANLALAQQEAENIAHVTRQSLLPLASGRSTGQADALSYKLWDSDWYAVFTAALPHINRALAELVIYSRARRAA